MLAEGGVNDSVVTSAIVTNSTAATATAVGAVEVRCLVGQVTRWALLQAFDTGPSTGALSIQIEGSIDGTTWLLLGTALATATTQLEEIPVTPWVRLYITTQGSTAYQMSLSVTE
ncbi:MAG: hypothetical protein V3S20_06475 [Dehalococcoidia bacterium]